MIETISTISDLPFWFWFVPWIVLLIGALFIYTLRFGMWPWEWIWEMIS